MTRNVLREVAEAGPATLTIFGITGDLSRRMILPALYHLVRQNLLPDSYKIVGISRRKGEVNTLLDAIKKSLKARGEQCDAKALRKLGDAMELLALDNTEPDSYEALRKRLDAIEDESKVCMNRLFYLAVPPELFPTIVSHLGTNGLAESCQHGTGQSRLLIEKPFGSDLASAKHLINMLQRHFAEEQLYRIDHFLAKETVQNLLTFRLRNPIFQTIWNASAINRIVVSATETLDIEGRVAFYEQTGALRDMIQSHVLQVLSVVMMELPGMPSAKQIHEEKAALLESLRPATASGVVRGQYEGYRHEVKNPHSQTETFVALELEAANNRWRGVPIFMRSGKALHEKLTEVSLHFKAQATGNDDNILVFSLAPNEGITLRLLAKKPGFADAMQDVNMSFCYNRDFADERQPSAYERVLLDVFRGDQTLFASSREVLASWRVIDDLLKTWHRTAPLHMYRKGSDGPEAAHELISKHGGVWEHVASNVCQPMQ
ncbi:MAG TPA: glucose-6-phosphate dehydrogenase [Candidatus Saccharimonadales bacterium]|nr:glucose-6-phosphate dehydrogenase [Candidatus Saccharimonadales bacterium]